MNSMNSTFAMKADSTGRTFRITACTAASTSSHLLVMGEIVLAVLLISDDDQWSTTSEFNSND